jgi:hypothetical protein
MSIERIATERQAALAATIDARGGYGLRSAPEGKVSM